MNQEINTATSVSLLVDDQRYTRRAFAQMFPEVASEATLSRWDATGRGIEREVIYGRTFYTGWSIKKWFAQWAVKDQAPQPQGNRYKHLPEARAKAALARRKVAEAQ
jgi:hypothetical protein